MGQKSRLQIKMQQKKTRKKARKALLAKGENLAKFYYGGFYLKEYKTK